MTNKSTLIELHDAKTDSAIGLAPENGLHWTNWRVRGHELLWHAEGYDKTPSRQTLPPGGSPLLFPAVGRTWDLTQTPPAPATYRLAPNGPTYAMPIHGFGADGMWILEESHADDESARVTYRCEIDDNCGQTNYPFRIEFRVTHTLTPSGVEIDFEARGDNAPFAFGIHPYFRIDSSCRIALPRRRAVLLHPGLGIPDETAASPTEEADEIPFQVGQTLDNVYALDDGATATLAGLPGGQTIGIESDGIFSHLVVYADGTNPFVCIEPWTAGLGGFCHLHSGKAGMLTATADETIRGTIRLHVE